MKQNSRGGDLNDPHKPLCAGRAFVWGRGHLDGRHLSERAVRIAIVLQPPFAVRVRFTYVPLPHPRPTPAHHACVPSKVLPSILHLRSNRLTITSLRWPEQVLHSCAGPGVSAAGASYSSASATHPRPSASFHATTLTCRRVWSRPRQLQCHRACASANATSVAGWRRLSKLSQLLHTSVPVQVQTFPPRLPLTTPSPRGIGNDMMIRVVCLAAAACGGRSGDQSQDQGCARHHVSVFFAFSLLLLLHRGG